MGTDLADDSLWPKVRRLAEASGARILPIDHTTVVSVLPDAALSEVVARSGGLLIDGGWLRVLGSGSADLIDIAAANQGALGVEPYGVLVGYDVLGGQFSLAAESTRMKPTIHYYQPDEVRWLDLMIGYAEWLMLMLDGSTTEFYADLRWPGWREDTRDCPLDKGYALDPPPWSSRGRDVSTVVRHLEPIAELVASVSAAHI